MRIVIAALFLVTATACLQSREGPPLHPQARVSYGTRVYAADRSTPPNPSLNGICSRMTTTVETFTNGSTTTTQTIDELVASGDFNATDGGSLTRDDLRRPQTCFVPILDDECVADDAPEDCTDTNGRAGTLLVDQLEVSNDLYQFCIDSGFCFEPDPSKADQNDICRVEGQDDGFFDCPALAVPVTEARRFCQYIGRRLPSAIESLIIRQAAWAANDDGTRIPETMRQFPATAPGSEPTDCSDAHLNAFGCGRPNPLQTATDNPEGSSVDDRVVDSVLGGAPIFDLTGHVSEWSGDGFQPNSDLPWFCLGPIQREPTEGRPQCPELTIPDGSDLTFRTGCVHGYYDPDDLEGIVVTSIFDDGLGEDPAPGVDLPYGLYPVCVIGSTGRFAGRDGALFGGSWRDDTLEATLAGSFGRRIETTPNAPEDTNLAQQYGIRCVDDREPGLDTSGRGFPFDSVPEGGEDPGPQIDVDFQP